MNYCRTESPPSQEVVPPVHPSPQKTSTLSKSSNPPAASTSSVNASGTAIVSRHFPPAASSLNKRTAPSARDARVPSDMTVSHQAPASCVSNGGRHESSSSAVSRRSSSPSHQATTNGTHTMAHQSSKSASVSSSSRPATGHPPLGVSSRVSSEARVSTNASDRDDRLNFLIGFSSSNVDLSAVQANVSRILVSSTFLTAHDSLCVCVFFSLSLNV